MNFTMNRRVNINELTQDERNTLTKSIYETRSYFQNIFSDETKEFDISHIVTEFRDAIDQSLLDKGLISSVTILESLHEHLSDEMRAYHFDDGVNKISTYFYDADVRLMTVYHKLIQMIRDTILPEPFYFQKTPTIRIHCPKGENSHHYPRYHTDIGYGHPSEEMNIWIPFTRLFKDHGFRLMNVDNSKKIIESCHYNFNELIKRAIDDHAFTEQCNKLSAPVTTDFGKLLMFDSRCIHTGEPLIWHSRVSMDIRIIPVSRFERLSIEYQGSGRRKILFSPGHCYHELDSDSFLANKE